MAHRVEKWPAFPTNYYMTFPQVILFVLQTSLMASSTTAKINTFDWFGLTCHIFCCCSFQKHSQQSRRLCPGCGTQTALQEEQEKGAHLVLGHSGWSQPVCRGRSLQPRRHHTALVPTASRGHTDCPLQLHPPKALPELATCTQCLLQGNTVQARTKIWCRLFLSYFCHYLMSHKCIYILKMFWFLLWVYLFIFSFL